MKVTLPTHGWSVILVILGLLALNPVVPAAATTPQSLHSSPRTSHSPQHYPITTSRHSHHTPTTLHISRRWHASKYQTKNESVTVDFHNIGKRRLNATYHIHVPADVSHETVSIYSYLFQGHPFSPTINWVKHGTANKSNGHIRWSGNGAFVFKITFHLPKNQHLYQASRGIQNGSFLRDRKVQPYITSIGPVPHWKYSLHTQFKAPGTHLYHLNWTGFSSLIYIGNATVKHTTVNGETITLFLPQTAVTTLHTTKSAPTPSQVLTAYRTEEKLLPVGVNPQHIRVLVLPPPKTFTGEEGATSSTTIEIWANTGLNQSWSPWLHEFVHTHQYGVYNRSTKLGPQIKWYQEADANYYADLVAYNENRIGFSNLYLTLKRGTSNQYKGILANTSTWDNYSKTDGRGIEYSRGPVILGYFDTHIRRQTHGNASFLNVMQTINTQEKHGKNLTLTRFKHDLEQYLPKKTVNHAVHAYIKGNQTIPISTRYSAFTLPPTSINTSRPAPPTPLGEKAYQRWLHHRDNTTSNPSADHSSRQSSTQTPHQSVTPTSSKTTTTNTPTRTGTTTSMTTSPSPSSSTTTSSPGFGIGIALIAISIASILAILRLRKSP